MLADHPHLIEHAGYGAIMLAICVESLGIPFPGEATLIAAAIYAGTTHGLNITLVITAAAAGAIIGGIIGFCIGRSFGFWLLTKYGGAIGMNERRIRLGQYLFLRYGGAVVFLGRFVALLRALASFLAGANRMSWPRFLAFNAAGGIVWSGLYGIGAYMFGKEIHHVAGPIALVLGAVALIASVTCIVFLRRNEKRLEDEAERALPGPVSALR